jgi:hypothetical protein
MSPEALAGATVVFLPQEPKEATPRPASATRLATFKVFFIFFFSPFFIFLFLYST